MKNTKKIIAVIMMATIICGVFVACSRGNERDKENAVINTVSVENNTQDIEEDKNNTTNKVTDAVTVNAATTDEQKTENQTVTNQQTETAQTTTKKVTTTSKPTTTKKIETTTKKNVTTTKKATQTTTKKVVQTTKKVTTTKKQTTTKKNVTAKEVQQQVNAYIKSKGIPVDASRTPNNSGWSTRINRTQERLNNGRVLKDCKGWVDLEIADGVDKMYCYYDSDWFYILYV